MSETKRMSAGPILAFGAVIVMIMLVGFGGVFYLVKYNHDRSLERDQAQREYEQRQKELAQRSADGERYAEIGSVVGDALGDWSSDKLADKLGDDDSKIEFLKASFEKLGETVGRELGESKRTKEFKEGLAELGEKLKEEIDKASDEPDGSGTPGLIGGHPASD